MTTIGHDLDTVMKQVLDDARRDFPEWDFAPTSNGWEARRGTVVKEASSVAALLTLLPRPQAGPVALPGEPSGPTLPP